MSANYNGFMQTCLNELLEIDTQIDLLDPIRDKERIAYLREEALKIQLRVDVFAGRIALTK